MIAETIKQEFSERGLELPQDFNPWEIEKHCKRDCFKYCCGEEGIIAKRGIFLFQFFCKGPYKHEKEEN